MHTQGSFQRKKALRIAGFIALALPVWTLSAGCNNDGDVDSAEDVGEALDDAADDVGDAVDDAVDEIDG